MSTKQPMRLVRITDKVGNYVTLAINTRRLHNQYAVNIAECSDYLDEFVTDLHRDPVLIVARFFGAHAIGYMQGNSGYGVEFTDLSLSESWRQDWVRRIIDSEFFGGWPAPDAIGIEILEASAYVCDEHNVSIAEYDFNEYQKSRASGNKNDDSWLKAKHAEWDDALHAHEAQGVAVKTGQSAQLDQVIELARLKHDADERDRRWIDHLLQHQLAQLEVLDALYAAAEAEPPVAADPSTVRADTPHAPRGGQP